MSAPFRPGGAHAHEHLAGARHGVGVLLDEDLAVADRGGAHRGEAYPALEQRDALDVMRLREHVHGAHPTQRPARLDELGGVGGERGRVAGDVDDPLGRGLDDAAHDLLRRARRGAGRRRARPGARRAATSSRSARRVSPAKKWALVISLRRAAAIASATACSTSSIPHSSPARGASVSAIVPMPAVEVVDALPALAAPRTRATIP